MKIIIIFSLIVLTVSLGSCSLDNYDGPNASLTGSIIDTETDELIQQELFQGSTIEYTELGYKNPQVQTLRFKTDGTFANLIMFAGKYTIQAVRGNFLATPLDTIQIKGNTEYIFKTIPYLRIKDSKVVLSSDSTQIIATFKIENIVNKPIKQIGLFIDQSSFVGTQINEVKKEVTVNSLGSSSKVYTLSFFTDELKKGKSYYVRIGALANIPESKYNWVTAVKIQL